MFKGLATISLLSFGFTMAGSVLTLEYRGVADQIQQGLTAGSLTMDHKKKASNYSFIDDHKLLNLIVSRFDQIMDNGTRVLDAENPSREEIHHAHVALFMLKQAALLTMSCQNLVKLIKLISRFDKKFAQQLTVADVQGNESTSAELSFYDSIKNGLETKSLTLSLARRAEDYNMIADRDLAGLILSYCVDIIDDVNRVLDTEAIPSQEVIQHTFTGLFLLSMLGEDFLGSGLINSFRVRMTDLLMTYPSQLTSEDLDLTVMDS